MSVTPGQLDAWMKAKENERLEFKEARSGFSFDKLIRYCVAFANEGGGRVILGVSDTKPRRVVGTEAFQDINRTKAGLLDRLHLRIEVDEFSHPDGRVLVLTVPPRPIGMPIEDRGSYWMRAGEGLVPMTPDVLRSIFAESGPDLSAQICPGASLADLHPEAIEAFRRMWRRRSGNEVLNQLPSDHLLRDGELLVDGGVTYAALILLGTREALGKYLPQAEVVFEYRSTETALGYQQRKEYRKGFFLFSDDLWSTINLRNDRYQYQDGLFVWDIPTFNEVVIREGILNAVSHREYRLTDSVLIRQFPAKIEIVSPGSFPPGITPQNILWRQSWRNRRIAEALAKCGLVERSGQGADRMFEECVREAKLPPDFTGTDDYQVYLTLHGEVRDPLFLRFLEEVGGQTHAAFSTADLVVLDSIHREQPVMESLRDRVPLLRELGVIERVYRKHILSRRFYSFAGKRGVYTRKRGLDRETNKALLLKHIRDNRASGSQMRELMDVLPTLSREQVRTLLQELRREKLVHSIGRTKAGRWYPGPPKEDCVK